MEAKWLGLDSSIGKKINLKVINILYINKLITIFKLKIKYTNLIILMVTAAIEYSFLLKSFYGM